MAKNALALDDIAYRAILEGSANVSSASELRTWAQFNEVMCAFRKLGFRSCAYRERNPNWMTAKQEAYIERLWRAVSDKKDAESLGKMAKRITGADSIRFLRKDGASKLINALRAMAVQKGLDPDDLPKEDAPCC